jgi:hypothetical protein
VSSGHCETADAGGLGCGADPERVTVGSVLGTDCWGVCAGAAITTGVAVATDCRLITVNTGSAMAPAKQKHQLHQVAARAAKSWQNGPARGLRFDGDDGTGSGTGRRLGGSFGRAHHHLDVDLIGVGASDLFLFDGLWNGIANVDLCFGFLLRFGTTQSGQRAAVHR